MVRLQLVLTEFINHNKMIDNNALSKVISHALRHAPNDYNIRLDKDGWIDINILVEALKSKYDEFSSLSESDIYEMINSSRKKRHEVNDKKIRAIYGHSVDIDINYINKKPPDKLYHGTANATAKVILKEGLKPMKRQYVHLSSTFADAVQVGRRKDKIPAILEINAYLAFNSGVNFYLADNNIWLSKFIPAEFIYSNNGRA